MTQDGQLQVFLGHFYFGSYLQYALDYRQEDEKTSGELSRDLGVNGQTLKLYVMGY
jgi:hypothetical protein